MNNAQSAKQGNAMNTLYHILDNVLNHNYVNDIPPEFKEKIENLINEVKQYQPKPEK